MLFVRRGIKASEACRALGWTENYLSRRLTGKQGFTVDDLETLASLLNVPITAFFPPEDDHGGDGNNAGYKCAPPPTRRNA